VTQHELLQLRVVDAAPVRPRKEYQPSSVTGRTKNDRLARPSSWLAAAKRIAIRTIISGPPMNSPSTNEHPRQQACDRAATC
jgi:hypothetical protein